MRQCSGHRTQPSYPTPSSQSHPLHTASPLSTQVPDTPSKSFGSPAFWFGVQTDQGDGALIQPIMAKWLGDGFYMFQEIFVRFAAIPRTRKGFLLPSASSLHDASPRRP